MAYTIEIKPNDKDANQSSPGWMLTFLRWENRDTLHYKDKAPLISNDKVPTKFKDESLREPLIVINDCVSLSVSASKNSLSSNFSAALVSTDINYSTAVAPGDFVFINIVSYSEQIDELYQRVKDSQPINRYNDGFKGLFKVQSVRRKLSVSQDGVKRLVYMITGHAFTELNNVVYFSPYLATSGEQQRPLSLFISNLGDEWRNTIIDEKMQNCQNVVMLLFRSLLGESIYGDSKKIKDGTMKTENRQFEMPKGVGKLLGISVTYAADMYRFIAGIQKYDKSKGTPAEGLFPSNSKGSTGTQSSIPLDVPCEGTCLATPDLWNQNQAWSIMKQFSNSEINEMFTCHRVFPNGLVLPTIVYRQIPFTTDHFSDEGATVTKFSSLPRWKIAPELLLDFDIGRDESARFNMVQLFGSTQVNSGPAGILSQIKNQNFVVDEKDIKRHGLKPLITSTQFDLSQMDVKDAFKSPRWARFRADWIMGGQLKENGHVTSIGIQEPICEGDNFQLGDYLFHIENISHSCQIAVNGIKQFRTTLSLSNGISVKSNSSKIIYDEMDNTDAYRTKQQDEKGLNILPGISDLQDIPGRVQGEEIANTKQKSFTLESK